MDSKAFLGSGLKFPLQVDPKTGKIAMARHEEDITEAIGIIIGTYRGERVMRPGFGATVSDYVFESTGSSVAESLAYVVREQLILQEPRIEDVRIKCDEHNGATGSFTVTVSYTVRSTNNRYNQVYPFYTGEEE